MRFTVTTPEPGSAVVAITGELDLGNIDRLTAAVDPILDAPVKQLVLEVGDLRFADSSAIAAWVQWSTRVERIELRNPSMLLRRVITTMGLAPRLRLEP
jgi:anti-anti-sigma factor